MNDIDVMKQAFAELKDAIEVYEEYSVWHKAKICSQVAEEFSKAIEEAEKREWVGLTDDDINFAYLKCEDLDDYARLLEAKLKEKNT